MRRLCPESLGDILANILLSAVLCVACDIRPSRGYIDPVVIFRVAARLCNCLKVRFLIYDRQFFSPRHLLKQINK
jgi:hypothetical protein